MLLTLACASNPSRVRAEDNDYAESDASAEAQAPEEQDELPEECRDNGRRRTARILSAFGNSLVDEEDRSNVAAEQRERCEQALRAREAARQAREPSRGVWCSSLILVAADGKYLGVAESNQYGPDSVCNQYSDYGSQYSATSIFNDYGEYGSKFSHLSAYNEVTSTPPALVCAERRAVLAYVTKNRVLAGGVDPDILCSSLSEQGM